MIDGFSAALDARGISLLEPRRRSPASTRSGWRIRRPSRAAQPAAGGGPGRGLTLPGTDGSGVTIALLDTGVDRSQPYLRGRVLPGYDVVRKHGPALARTKPGDPASIEEHGTELAGVLVGAGGPSGLAGVATGATVLPLRVAGWQANASGGWSIYARTDQLVAGLERAVDPNANGDAHDAARIALVGLAAPFAAFADDPVARRGGRRGDGSTRSSSRPPGTTVRRGRASAASPGPGARRLRSPSAPPIYARRAAAPVSWCAPGSACCSTPSCRSPGRSRRAMRSGCGVAQPRPGEEGSGAARGRRVLRPARLQPRRGPGGARSCRRSPA